MKELKKYRHIILIVLAGVMAVGTVFAIVEMLFFVGVHLNTALNFTPASPPAVQFDTQGFDQLHLTQQSQ